MRAFALIFAVSLGSLVVHADADVPFHATIDTEVATTGACGATCVVLSISGTGTGSHMGSLDMVGPSQINFATLRQTGTSTLTAADGSTLTLSFTGTFTPGPGPADATFGGTWTATDGTRRFDNVSGGGTYHGNASGPAGVLFLDGSLSNPGKKP